MATSSPLSPPASPAPRGGAVGGRLNGRAGDLPSGQYDASVAGDDELLSRLALGKGRETALPELFARHGERYLRLAQRILGDWHTAEEAVQDSFLRLAQKAPLWRGECGFNTFFTRLLVNVCRSRRRRGHDVLAKGRNVGTPSTLMSGLAASSRITEVAGRMQAEETRRAVREALERLPEKYREVLILRELEGLAYKEIADVLEASLDEVRIWIYRGREHLRGILEGRAEEFLE